MPELQMYTIAIVGAFIAGGINTLAGNGSAITLTILTEILGLPPNVANGTNRIGIFSQCAAASFVFHKNGKLQFGKNKTYLTIIILGAVAGGLLAVYVSNEQFKAVFKFMMVFMLISGMCIFLCCLHSVFMEALFRWEWESFSSSLWFWVCA